MTEDTIQQAEASLISADPILGKLIKSQAINLPAPRPDYFTSLVRSVIGQQVSVAAARAIAKRFTQQTEMIPSKVSDLTIDEMRSIGLSRQKAGYIQDLAKHFVSDPSTYDHLESLSDNEVIAELTVVKGIGTWTAQMFLISTLQRPDVFAPDDAGLQRAMIRLYQWKELPPKKQLALTADQWRPYRTIASLHLWQSLDNNPT